MITVIVVPGFIPSSTELWTNAKFAQLGKPTFVVSGTIGTSDMADGAITAVKTLPDAYWYAVTTGTGAAYVLTLNPALASLTEGAEIWFRLHADAGVAPTLNVNALGAKALVKRGSIAIAAGDFRAGQMVGARYYNNQWQIFSAAAYQDVINGGVSTGSGTALAITPSPAFPAYSEMTDRVFVFQANVANTGAVTLQVSALAGPKPIVKAGGASLDAGDIALNQWVAVRFDGTSFHVISAINRSDNVTAVDSGTTDTYAATVASVSLSAYFAGLRIWLKCNTKNTGAATFNLNGVGAGTIKKLNNLDLQDGDIQAGQWVHLIHDGANWQLIGASSTVVSADFNLLTAAAGNVASFVHGFGQAPRFVRWVLVAQATPGLGATAADEVDIANVCNNTNGNQGLIPVSNATNLILGQAVIDTNLAIIDRSLFPATNTNNFVLTTGKWKARCYYAP